MLVPSFRSIFAYHPAGAAAVASEPEDTVVTLCPVELRALNDRALDLIELAFVVLPRVAGIARRGHRRMGNVCLGVHRRFLYCKDKRNSSFVSY